MDSVIKRMLVNAYELEGILLLAQERGEATPKTVLSIIKEKAELLLDDANSLNVIEATPDEEIMQEPSVEPFVESEEPETSDVLQNDETEQNDNSEDKSDSEAFAAVASTMEKIKLFQEREQDDNESMSFYYEAEPEEEESEDSDAENEEVEEDAPGQEGASEEMSSEEIVVEDEIISPEEVGFDSREDLFEVEEVDEVESLGEIEEVSSDEATDHKDSSINIEDAYIRNKSKDLRSAFSINDTFRFRRELFGNSAADMSDAINLVIAMNSYEEAEDYFYGDLMWDSESDEVKEFMEIIRNHFL